MPRTLVIIAIVVAVLCLVVGYYALHPSPNAGDVAKLERTFTPDEQALLETRTISTTELGTKTGKDGAEAWIAVNGVVYDVTAKWPDGRHHGLTAGRDLTEKFVASKHAAATLQDLPVVGRYEAES